MPSITERIKTFNQQRDPGLQKQKYAAMSENVFRFFRGTCHIFYEDLAQMNLDISSPLTWICGDLHLENFGSFKGDNRLVYFDINDFDEAVLAPVHWELLRIVSSIYVALQSLDINKQQADDLAILFLQHYTDTLRRGKALYIERKTTKGIIGDFLEQASQKKHREIIDKHITGSGNKSKIALRDGRYFAIEKPLKKQLLDFMQNWLTTNGGRLAGYTAIDCAFRLAGTGGLGMKRYGFLLRSATDESSKFLLLDMKEAKVSATAAFVKTVQPVWESEAHRITELQYRMQNCPPALLSPACFHEAYFIIKELQPQKDSIDFRLLCDHYDDMCQVIKAMAILTASAQLRSSGRQGSAIADELISFGTAPHWQQAIINYASMYSEKTKGYFDEFVREVNNDR